MTPEELKKYFPNASPSTIKRNLQAKTYPLVTLPDPKHQPDPIPALDQGPKTRVGRKKRVVIIVTCISFRRRLLDDDNLSNSFKSVRDAVAHSIGLDDGDKRFRWQYAQVRTDGEEGSLVTVEVC